MAPISAAGVFFKEPPKEPMAVLQQLTTYKSFMNVFLLIFIVKYRCVRAHFLKQPHDSHFFNNSQWSKDTKMYLAKKIVIYGNEKLQSFVVLTNKIQPLSGLRRRIRAR
jgi:hypothetical protein